MTRYPTSRCFKLAMLAVVVVLVFEMISIDAALADDGPMLEVTVKSAPINVNRDGKNTKVGEAKKGDHVYALKTKGEFYRVIAPDTRVEGWIYKKYVTEALYFKMDEVTQLEENAAVKFSEGNIKGALKEYEKLVPLGRTVFNDQHPQHGWHYINLARCHEELRELSKAEMNYKTAIKMFRRWYGEDHDETLLVVRSLAQTFALAERYEQARQLLTDGLRKTERRHGPDSEKSEPFLSSLGFIYFNEGKHQKAAETYKRSLRICKRLNGENDISTALAQQNLAIQWVRLGKYEAATPLYLQAIRTIEKINGKNHPQLIHILLNLSDVYSSQGKAKEAGALVKRAYEISVRSYGENNAQTALCLSFVATHKNRVLDFAGEEESAKRSYQIFKSTFGDAHSRTSTAINRLGLLYMRRNEFGLAESYFRVASKNFFSLFGKRNRRGNFSYSNLAFALREQKKYDEAYGVYDEIIQNLSEATGEDDVIGYAHGGQAAVSYRTNKTMEAQTSFKRAVASLEKHFSGDNVATAEVLGELANVQVCLEEFDVAKSNLTLSNKILNRVAPKNRYVHKNLATLSRLEYRSGNIEIALKNEEQCQKTLRERLSSALPKMSYEERTATTATARDFFHQGLSFGYLQHQNRRTAIQSAGWLINSKGILQEAVAESSLYSTPDTVPLFYELQSIQERLAKFALKGNELDDESRKLASSLEAKQQQLQQEIASKGLGINSNDPWVTTGSLMSKIPYESVIVNVARFRLRNFQNQGYVDRFDDVVYAAWIIPSVGEGTVTVVPLGNATAIDKAVEELRFGLDASLLQDIASAGEANSEKAFRKSSKTLSDLVLKPIEPFIKDAKQLIISPDGELWNVPWESLILSNDDYLIEKFRTRYILSGRELVYKQPERSLINAPAIFADPNYDLSASHTDAHDGKIQNRLRSSSGAYFPRLAKSAAEAKAIRPKIESLTGETAQIFMQSAAQEAAFKNLHRPKMLVISTHGYFDSKNENSGAAERQFGQDDNPLLRCGLAFAGCNNRNEAANDNAQDGILTGLEIVGTDLRGTELVVLSACETGVGDTQNGEGVAGLRQAFQLAGAETVLASLWQVDDAETARLMNSFFDNLAKGMAKSDALRQAQLSRIKARRARHGAAHPFFWAAFTLTGQD